VYCVCVCVDPKFPIQEMKARTKAMRLGTMDSVGKEPVILGGVCVVCARLCRACLCVDMCVCVDLTFPIQEMEERIKAMRLGTMDSVGKEPVILGVVCVVCARVCRACVCVDMCVCVDLTFPIQEMEERIKAMRMGTMDSMGKELDQRRGAIFLRPAITILEGAKVLLVWLRISMYAYMSIYKLYVYIHTIYRYIGIRPAARSHLPSTRNYDYRGRKGMPRSVYMATYLYKSLCYYVLYIHRYICIRGFNQR